MTNFTTGSPKNQNVDNYIGKKLGKYEVIEKLGQGAMGVVLKVWDTLEEVFKAIKMVPPEVAYDDLSFEQLKNEVNSSSKITHTNVIRVMGLEEFQGLYFIVMEYIEGETLSKKLLDSGEKIEEEIVLDYMKQICSGLKEAHNEGVVHLDLKPQNIMITNKNKIKILDFSISYQITKSMTMLTGKNMSTGTLPYMAPEQLSKKYGRINEQTDIWGLGATMYLLLSGDVPFETENQIKDPNENPFELEDISDKTKKIISSCLTKDRNKRFKKISDLENALSGQKLESKRTNHSAYQQEKTESYFSHSQNKEPEVQFEVIPLPLSERSLQNNSKMKYIWIAAIVVVSIFIWVILKGTSFNNYNKQQDNYGDQKKVTHNVFESKNKKELLKTETSMSEIDNELKMHNLNNSNNTIGEKKIIGDTFFSIQIGAFRNHEGAKKEVLRFSTMYSTEITKIGDLYKVRIGSYRTKKRAEIEITNNPKLKGCYIVKIKK